MTQTVTIDLEDAKNLATLPDRMLNRALEVLRRNAELMRDYAQVLCPVDTGVLRDSIRVEQDGNGFHVVAGGPGVEYAEIVEARQPFMFPAWLMVRDSIDAEINVECAEEFFK